MPQPEGRIKASPLARSIAVTHNLDLALITGSGPGGRVVKADILRALDDASPSTEKRVEKLPEGVLKAVGAKEVLESIPIQYYGLTGDKVDCSLHDCLMSGFAMMFFQDPSILTFQQRLQDKIQKNNLTTVSGVKDIPKDTQMSEVADSVLCVGLEDRF